MFSQPLITFIIGSIVSITLMTLYHQFKMGSYQRFFQETLEKNEHEMEQKRHQLELELQRKNFENQKICDNRSQEIDKKAQYAKERHKNLEDKLSQAIKKNERLSKDFDKKTEELKELESTLLKDQENVIEIRKAQIASLEEIATMTQQEAEEQLFKKLSLDVKKKCAIWSAKYIKEKKHRSEQDAQKLLIDAINRIASSCSSQSSITTVHLPHSDMKSKVIGREGRNINLLENLLGVNVLVDETPRTIIISSMDPLRRAIAKQTLEQLLQDGRIHPTKIEESYAKAKQIVNSTIRKNAEDVALKLGILDLHPEIIEMLARMSLMNSAGQNLLKHSNQVALIMGMIASELHLDVQLAKRIGLLHDIGKTAVAEMNGTHAMIGFKLAKQLGETQEVANGIGCHHGEMTPMTIEGSLCGAADAISAARPGARSESLQHFFKRIKKLEAIAQSYDQVDRAYALQAGREIRVITVPDKVDDDTLCWLAQDLAKKIEQEMKYSGQIKVSVLREQQVIEFAS